LIGSQKQWEKDESLVHGAPRASRWAPTLRACLRAVLLWRESVWGDIPTPRWPIYPQPRPLFSTVGIKDIEKR